MRSHSDELSTWVILSGAKDVTAASLITLRKQRDTNSVSEVRRFVRDDGCPTRHHALYTERL